MTNGLPKRLIILVLGKFGAKSDFLEYCESLASSAYDFINESGIHELDSFRLEISILFEWYRIPPFFKPGEWKSVNSGLELMEYFNQVRCVLAESESRSKPTPSSVISSCIHDLLNTCNHGFTDMQVLIFCEPDLSVFNASQNFYMGFILKLYYVHGCIPNIFAKGFKDFEFSWNNFVKANSLCSDELCSWINQKVLWRGNVRIFNDQEKENNNCQQCKVILKGENCLEKTLNIFENKSFLAHAVINEFIDPQIVVNLEDLHSTESALYLEFENFEILANKHFVIEFKYHMIDKYVEKNRSSLWSRFLKYLSNVTSSNQSQNNPLNYAYEESLYMVAVHEDNAFKLFNFDSDVFSNLFRYSMTPNAREDIGKIEDSDDFEIAKMMDNKSPKKTDTKSCKTLLRCASYNKIVPIGTNIKTIQKSNSRFSLNNSTLKKSSEHKKPPLNNSYLSGNDNLISPNDETNKKSMIYKKLIIQIDAMLQRKLNADVNSDLYKRCRKRLYRVCRSFVDDLNNTDNLTNQLYCIVKSNVKQVLDFENLINKG